MHSVTDRRTDGQQAYANSRSYCVAVRSAKNEHIKAVQAVPASTRVYDKPHLEDHHNILRYLSFLQRYDNQQVIRISLHGM